MQASTVKKTLGVTVIVSAAVCVFLIPGVRASTLDVLSWVEGLGPWGPAALVVIYILATLAMVPGTLLTLGAGAAFGFWVGLVAVILGSNLGAIVSFLFGRTLLRDWTESLAARNARFAALDNAVAKSGFRLVLLTRLSPIFPFNFLNYSFGVTQLSLKDYTLATVIGMLPGTVLIVYLGTAAKSLAQLEETTTGNTATQWLFGFGLVLSVVVTVYICNIILRAMLEQPEESREPRTES